MLVHCRLTFLFFVFSIYRTGQSLAVEIKAVFFVFLSLDATTELLRTVTAIIW